MNNTKTFDPNKPVQTRDERKARILCTDRKHNEYPLVVLIDEEIVKTYTKHGTIYVSIQSNTEDLINIPEKHTIEIWINIYKDIYKCMTHQTKEIADRIACKKLTIEYTEGEGLDTP